MANLQEDAKPIPNFPNYCITKDGKVWSARRKGAKGGWLAPIVGTQKGHFIVNLCNHRMIEICDENFKVI